MAAEAQEEAGFAAGRAAAPHERHWGQRSPLHLEGGPEPLGTHSCAPRSTWQQRRREG